jgi:hypothetical protein
MQAGKGWLGVMVKMSSDSSRPVVIKQVSGFDLLEGDEVISIDGTGTKQEVFQAWAEGGFKPGSQI